MNTEQKQRLFEVELNSNISAYESVLKEAISSRDRNNIEDLNDFYDGEVKKWKGKLDSVKELKESYDKLFK